MGLSEREHCEMSQQIHLERGTARQMMAKAELTTRFLKAISHPARLVILCRLAEASANVGELEDFAGLPQSEVSKHLARLRGDGLVRAERNGRARTYALSEPRSARVMQVLYHEFCAEEPDQPES